MSHPLYIPLTLVAILLVGAILLAARASRNRRATRERFIRGYAFPPIVRERILREHPEWSREDLEGALDGLRAFFLSCLAAKGTIVQMTSRAADDAWHEFIVCTREYRAFCLRAFGRFLHHKPDDSSAPGADAALMGGGYFAGSSGNGHHGHHDASGGHGHGCSGGHGHGCSGGGGCSSH
ncbi:MAG TPA: hypothetical protein VN598_16650 [Usitatibacter sp.]|nr:hypothetical protein [Usitatibacter sp.]